MGKKYIKELKNKFMLIPKDYHYSVYVDDNKINEYFDIIK